MLGRIKALGSGSTSGVIKAEDGTGVYFDLSAVLAYDATCLSVGQLVTFDIESGNGHKAANVCVQASHRIRETTEKRPAPSGLRYAGFEQKASIRVYRFERRSPGENTETYMVTADLTLFTKHHVGLQDGPALSLHLLTKQLDAVPPQVPCTLTSQNMLDYLASLPVKGPRPGPRRTAHTARSAAVGSGFGGHSNGRSPG